MSTYSPDSQGSLWPPEPTASAPSPCAKLTPDAERSSPKRGRESRSGMTCERSVWPTPAAEDVKNGRGKTGNREQHKKDKAGLKLPESIRLFGSLPLASPVSLPHGPGSSEARQMTAGSGRRLLRFLPTSSPLGRFSRILLASETWASPEFYLKWEHSVTKCGSSVFRLVPSAPRIDGSGTGLLQDTWQTPAQHQFEKRRQVGQTTREELLLPGQVKAMASACPTPDASADSGGRCGKNPGQRYREDGTKRSIPCSELTRGPMPSSCLARTESFVVRLATLSGWLMGYTAQYLAHWGTASSRRSRRGSSQL